MHGNDWQLLQNIVLNKDFADKYLRTWCDECWAAELKLWDQMFKDDDPSPNGLPTKAAVQLSRTAAQRVRHDQRRQDWYEEVRAGVRCVVDEVLAQPDVDGTVLSLRSAAYIVKDIARTLFTERMRAVVQQLLGR